MCHSFRERGKYPFENDVSSILTAGGMPLYLKIEFSDSIETWR